MLIVLHGRSQLNLNTYLMSPSTSGRFLMISWSSVSISLSYILLYFSYRGNNDVAGHAFASAREPIEQEVGVYFVSYDWYNQPIRLKLEKEYRPEGRGVL